MKSFDVRMLHWEVFKNSFESFNKVQMGQTQAAVHTLFSLPKHLRGGDRQTDRQILR